MWRMQCIQSVKLSEKANFASNFASRKSALRNSFERWVTSRESSRLQPVQSVDKTSAPRATTSDPAQEESWNAAAADRAPSSSSGVGPARNGAGTTADVDSSRRGPNVVTRAPPHTPRLSLQKCFKCWNLRRRSVGLNSHRRWWEFQFAKISFRYFECCLLYTSPSPRDRQKSRMPSSA